MTVIGGPDIVEDGLVLYLDAANPDSYPGSGTTWKDLSGNGNDGTLTNGPTFDSGNGGSIVFDGVNDFVTTSLFTLSSSSSTITCWCFITNFTTTNNIPAVTLIGDTSSINNLISFWDGGYGFETNTNSNPVEFFGQTAAPISTTAITSQRWFNFTLVFDNNVSYGYVNGNLVDSRNISDNLQFRYIGRPAAGGRADYPSWFKGKLSQIKVYSNSLTSQEVLQNYNATKSRYGL